MLKFHLNNSTNYIEYVASIAKSGEKFTFTTLYARKPDEAESLNKNLALFSFPFPQLILKGKEQSCFSYCFTDVDKKPSYCFIKIEEKDGKVPTAFCLVSEYYHPTLHSEIINRIAGLSTEEQIKSYVKDVLSLTMIHRSQDWFFSNNANGLFVNSADHLSPPNEISKLYQYLFSKIPVPEILSLLIAMLLDLRIIIISSNMSELGNMSFACLALIYPLQWPGSFIPVLPQQIKTTLEAPFAYIIGLHSTMADILLTGSIDRYFVINVDAQYCAIVGMDDYPQNILSVVDTFADEIRGLIKLYSPVFPFQLIQKSVRNTVVHVLSTAYDIQSTEMKDIYDSFNNCREAMNDEFSSIISQTQFIDRFMQHLFIEPDADVIKAFWPNAQIPTNQTRGPAIIHSTNVAKDTGVLRYNSGKALGLLQNQPERPNRTVSQHPMRSDIKNDLNDS